MVGGGQCSSVIEVILTLLGDNRGAPSGWRIIHSNNNNNNKNSFNFLEILVLNSHENTMSLSASDRKGIWQEHADS